jgi:hypothetical protein
MGTMASEVGPSPPKKKNHLCKAQAFVVES